METNQILVIITIIFTLLIVLMEWRLLYGYGVLKNNSSEEAQRVVKWIRPMMVIGLLAWVFWLLALVGFYNWLAAVQSTS